MALASLYARTYQGNTSLPKPCAIIIDHKLRPESTDEANWVAEQLRQNCETHFWIWIERAAYTLQWTCPRRLFLSHGRNTRN